MDDNAVVIADASGVIRFWSPGAEAAFGYSAARAVGQTLDLIVPPEHRAAHWMGFRRAMETGAAESEGVIGALPVRCASGEVAAAPGRLALVRAPQGPVIAAILAFEAPGARRAN